ncbi:MAG: helicase-related protein, partial [Casimicrobiaceae bacterium]
ACDIDVLGITHVINFDLPRAPEDYVHRIGRTGRAGAAGVAVSLANHSERGNLRQIERFTGAAIPIQVVPGLEPRARPNRETETRRPAFSKPTQRAHARPRSGSDRPAYRR